MGRRRKSLRNGYFKGRSIGAIGSDTFFGYPRSTSARVSYRAGGMASVPALDSLLLLNISLLYVEFRAVVVR